MNTEGPLAGDITAGA